MNLVEGGNPESGNDVAFAPVVAIEFQGPFIAGPRSISKPSSSSELSNHEISIWLDDIAVAERLLGAEGVVAGVGVGGGGTGGDVRGGVGVDVGVDVDVGVAVGGTGVGVDGGVGVAVGVAVGTAAAGLG